MEQKPNIIRQQTPKITTMHKVAFVLFGLLIIAIIAASVAGYRQSSKSSSTTSDASAININDRIDVSGLPSNLYIYGLQEEYDKGKGQYNLHFTVVNKGKKKIDFPVLEADLIIGGSVAGKPQGGPGVALAPGEGSSMKLHWLLPHQVPDRIVLRDASF